MNGLLKTINNQKFSKLSNPDFVRQLTKDIILLCETHTGTNEALQLSDYKCVTNCRYSDSSRFRGGLAVFIKHNISKGVKIIDKSLSNMMVLKLNHSYFGFKNDIYLCALYLSPANSSYTRRNDMDSKIFDKLEQDIIKYSNLGKIILIGDMNAHINKLDMDFIENEMDDILDDSLPDNYIADNVHLMSNTQINQTTNAYGRNILDLCISSQLRILNGRTLGDSSGKATFHVIMVFTLTIIAFVAHHYYKIF